MTRRRRIVAALLTGAVATALAAAALTGLPSRAEAAPAATGSAASILQSFNPADIISDAVMYNPSTMSVAQIQSFLNAQQPTCASGYTCLKTYRTNTQTMAANLMCGTYTGASNESAATIIYKVAHACRVNPQVILVTLQKEQGLITGVNLSWYPNAYRSATGLACPDTAPCDPSKYGFFNQVYGLGYWLIRYTTPPGTTGPDWTSFSWFPVGKKSAILYNPDASCGSQLVTIANKATASLYYYTPYVPNAAALAAGYSTGDSCSAYGNRNFFLYFTQWFGSTHISVTGAIDTYWTAHASSLGAPTANAVTSTKNGGGSYQTFQHGTVYSSKAGTFAITGALLTEYNRRGGVGGSLQWPVADRTTVTANGGGLMQRFGSGELYSSAAGTYAVRGDLRTAYLALGGVNGSMGFPKDTAVTLSTGWVQHFTKGTVYFQTDTGGFGVPSAIDAGYTTRNGPTGSLGWPTRSAAARTAAGISGTVQEFEKGDVYSSKAGTAAVLGPVRSAFTTSADSFDVLGWPVADATTTTAHGGGTVQVFTGGRLYVPTGEPAIALSAPILTTYLARGEVGGSLGWPISTQATVTAHGTSRVVQSFQTGAAYLTGTSVTTVTGGLYAEYVADGGPTGSLGWVTGPARHTSAAGGGWSQTFSGGTLFYSSTSKRTYPLTGAILKLYLARGSAAGTLGWPIGKAADQSAHGSTRTVQAFQGGSAYQSGSSVTTVTGGLYSAYQSAGGPAGVLGWVTGPARKTSVAGGGWTQTFSGGTDYYSSKTHKAYPVTGSMLSLYRARGEAGGSFGWPVSSAAALTAHGTTQTVQTFQLGSFTRSGSTIRTVNGGLYRAYAAAGGPAGAVGWVTGSARHTTASGGGWTQTFTGARIYYSSASHHAYPVADPILSLYIARHEASGSLGWPTGVARTVTSAEGPRVVQSFQGGSAYADGGTVTTVTGSLYRKYVSGRGHSGPLGWVAGDAEHTSANGSGWTQVFAHGAMLYSAIAHASHAVLGDILTFYRQHGGPAGGIGWPTGDAATKGAVTTQAFQNGTITASGGTAGLE